MYGEIYYHTYCIQDTDEPARLSIFKRDYVGASTFVDAGPVPIQTGILNSDEDSIGGVYPTMAKIQLIGDEEFGMEDLYTADSTEFMVEHWVNGVLDWKGYMAAEAFGEEDTCGNRYLNINALDGLTLLKDFKFVDSDGRNYGVSSGNFERNIIFILREAFLKTGLDLPFKTQTDRQVVNATIEYSKTRVFIEQGVMYSDSFLGNALVQVGNYIRYKEDQSQYTGNAPDSWLVSRVEEILEAGRGVRVVPAPPAGLNDWYIDYGFFTPEPVVNQDVLALATVDVRNFIAIQDNVEEGQPERDYYISTDGTFSTWDVLDSIARVFDLRVTQRQGKWEAIAVDSHRVTTEYYDYDSTGTFTGRSAGIPVKLFSNEDSLSYRLAGGTRFFGKVLKNVTINYSYRYKTDGDDLVNLLTNGELIETRTGPFDPSTYTPEQWQRISLPPRPTPLPPPSDNFPLHLDNILGFPIGSPRELEFYTPNSAFPRNNTVSPLPVISLTSGDKITLSMLQSIYETRPDGAFTIVYNAFTVKFVGASGKVYYLVNKGDQQGWSDRLNMSPNPTGQWLEEGNVGNVWYFINNYSSGHTTGNTLTWSERSRINVTMDPIPENGNLQIFFSGPRFGYYSSSGRDIVLAYQIVGEEDGQFIYGLRDNNVPGRVISEKGAGNPDYRVRIGDVRLTRITSEASGGIGRTYGYIRPGSYSDEITVPVDFGDENNVDHMSTIKVNGRVQDLWQDSSGELGVGSIGLTLARSLMRRYYHPMAHLDGGYRDTLPKPSDVLDLYGDGKLFRLKTGDISHCYRLVEGSLEQLSTIDIPLGGYDRGAGSMATSRGGGSGGSSGGGSGGFVPSPGSDTASKLLVGEPPETATSPGQTGQVVITDGYVYYCTAPNTWRRAAINTW